MQASTAIKQTSAGKTSPAPAEVEEVTGQLIWLSKELLTRTGRDVFRRMEALDVSISHCKLMQLLADSERPMSVKGLSDAIGLSLPAVSRSVDTLVKRGYATREEDPTDRRAKRVSLTGKGKRTTEGLWDIRAAGLRQWVTELEPDQRTALLEGLRPVVRR